MLRSDIKIGSVVTFTYKGKVVHDRFPQVLILHKNWKGFVHGLNLNYLSDLEIRYIKSVLNPDVGEKMSAKYPLVRQMLKRVMNPSNLNINSPFDFYVRFVRNFIRPRGWDPYRRYNPNAVFNPKVIIRPDVLLGKRVDNMARGLLEGLEHKRG